MGQNEVGMEGGGVLDYRINGIDNCRTLALWEIRVDGLWSYPNFLGSYSSAARL